jgi:anti-sigma factor RsiW
MTTPNMTLDCDGFADALADYLEGDATDGVRSAVEAHASSCAACQQLLTDLNAVRVDAAALPELVPSRDLWSGIAERIDARIIPMETPRVAPTVTRRTWLRPAVAAAALVLFTAGVTHYLTRVSLLAPDARLVASAAPVTEPATAVAEPTATIVSTSTERPTTPRAETRTSSPIARLASAEVVMDAADPVFAGEITKLRKIVRERRSQLDPKTVAVLEQSIAVIDSAIAQSRAALAKDPASGFLATQLNHSLEKKVELLRTAALLPTRI